LFVCFSNYLLVGGALYDLSTEPFNHIFTDNKPTPTNSTLPSIDLGNYIVTPQILGEGASAVVRLGFEKESQKKVAVKVASKLLESADPAKVEKRRKAVMREIDTLNYLNSLEEGAVNCIQLLAVMETETSYFLIFEYKDSSLHSFIKKRRQFSEEEARKLFKQLVRAVAFLHKHKIAHRDIKAEVPF
jgi:serine/threonine protein kinase